MESLRINHKARGKSGSASGIAAAALAVFALAFPLAAHASFLPPEMMDTAAMGLAWFVICAARTALLRVQSERPVQRVNLHLAVGGGFETRPAAAAGPQTAQ